MNCMLKSGQAKTKTKKKKEINISCCGPQSLALEIGVVRAKNCVNLGSILVPQMKTYLGLNELVTLVSSMTYFLS